MTTIPSESELFDLIATEALVERTRLSRDAVLRDLGIASLDVISILFEVENRFGARVEDSELADCATLGDLVDRLKTRLATPA